MTYLETLRYFRPNPHLLSKLTQGRVLSSNEPPKEADLLRVLK